MRLYRTSAGRFAGTQADAGKGFVRCDIPDDKSGLIAFLNQLGNGHQARPIVAAALPDPAPDPAPPPPLATQAPRPARDMSATAHLSRMANLGVDIDAMVETIASCDMYTLKRFAGAVAVRFGELAK